jgi:hypothetical protein
VLAELYLAENALALHLPLQRLEGLIDIVVADENLHVVLLFNQPGPWATGARIQPPPGRIYSNRLFRGRTATPRNFYARASIECKLN